MKFFICLTHFSSVSFDLKISTLTGAPNILLTLLFLASLENFKKCLDLISSLQISENHLKV